MSFHEAAPPGPPGGAVSVRKENDPFFTSLSQTTTKNRPAKASPCAPTSPSAQRGLIQAWMTSPFQPPDPFRLSKTCLGDDTISQ